MTLTILVLNGPNLNLLGTRQPEIYGSTTLSEIETQCRAMIADRASLDFRQSNHEGQLVDWIQGARGTADAIVINAGGYTHTSVAILDALNMFDGTVIELHISNIYEREEFRHHSYIKYRADEQIVGKGVAGYEIAIRNAASRIGVDL